VQTGVTSPQEGSQAWPSPRKLTHFFAASLRPLWRAGRCRHCMPSVWPREWCRERKDCAVTCGRRECSAPPSLPGPSAHPKRRSGTTHGQKRRCVWVLARRTQCGDDIISTSSRAAPGPFPKVVEASHVSVGGMERRRAKGRTLPPLPAPPRPPPRPPPPRPWEWEAMLEHDASSGHTRPARTIFATCCFLNIGAFFSMSGRMMYLK
jgi:hypothetical protein